MSSTKLLGIYSNGMVLQRNKDIVIEGYEDSLENVVITIAGSKIEAPVKDGKFKGVFAPMDAAFDLELKVIGSNEITVKDVCIGDVYMLAGQSNMELPVGRTYELNKEEIEAKDYPYIRQYLLTPDMEIPEIGGEGTSTLPEVDWINAVGKAKCDFSAVGFYAAKRIFEERNVPIGLIACAQGGSTIEAWMCDEDLYASGVKEEAIAPLRGKGAVKAYFEDWQNRTTVWRAKAYDNDFKIEEALSSTKPVTLPGIVIKDFAGVIWFIKEFEYDGPTEGECLLRLGDLIDADVTYINGIEVGRTEYQYPPRIYPFDASVLKQGTNTLMVKLTIELGSGGFVEGHPYYLKTPVGDIDIMGEWQMVEENRMENFQPIPMAQMLPATLYYASVLPIRNIAISQIWWYQGESNADAPEGYDQKMIRCFGKMREFFGDVPVVLVKMADYINPLTFATEVPDGWKEIQRLQEEAPNFISNSASVVAPCPDPIYELHPQNKSELGADVAKASIKLSK